MVLAHRNENRPGRRGLAKVLAGAALMAAGAAVAAESLTVVSWGGSYGRASRLAVLEPFSAETGIEVKVEDYNGGLAQIRAQVETGIVTWDVVDLETPDLVRGCDEALLEEVDREALPPAADGTPAAEDYFPDTMTDCGPATLFYATIVAYNSELYPDGKPRPNSIADFFDLEKFPGRRGMRRLPQVNLEFALMADASRTTKCTRRLTPRPVSNARSTNSTPSRTASCGGRRAPNRRRYSPTRRWP